MKDDDGRVRASGHGKYRRVEVRRIVDAPIERVWEAITSAEELRQWWTAGLVEPREGGRIKLEMDTDECGGLPLDGRVLACLPPHVFEFTWHEAYDPAMGVVRFDLIEVEGGRTQVTLTNLIPADDVVPASAGWHEILERLGTYIRTSAPVPVSEGDRRFKELHAIYESELD